MPFALTRPSRRGATAAACVGDDPVTRCEGGAAAVGWLVQSSRREGPPAQSGRRANRCRVGRFVCVDRSSERPSHRFAESLNNAGRLPPPYGYSRLFDESCHRSIRGTISFIEKTQVFREDRRDRRVPQRPSRPWRVGLLPEEKNLQPRKRLRQRAPYGTWASGAIPANRSVPPWRASSLLCSTGGQPSTGDSLGLGAARVGRIDRCTWGGSSRLDVFPNPSHRRFLHGRSFARQRRRGAAWVGGKCSEIGTSRSAWEAVGLVEASGVRGSGVRRFEPAAQSARIGHSGMRGRAPKVSDGIPSHGVDVRLDTGTVR
jgi:hypothetical protein